MAATHYPWHQDQPDWSVPVGESAFHDEGTPLPPTRTYPPPPPRPKGPPPLPGKRTPPQLPVVPPVPRAGRVTSWLLGMVLAVLAGTAGITAGLSLPGMLRPSEPEPEPAAEQLADVVDVSNGGGGACQTLAEAVQKVRHGGRIRVAAGIYPESLVLEKDVELSTGGGEVVILGRGESCLVVRGARVVLDRIRLQVMAGAGKRAIPAVHVARKGGGVVDLRGCEIANEAGDGLLAEGPNSTVHLARCRITLARGRGLHLRGRARGTAEDCQILNTAERGIEVAEAAHLVLLRTAVRYGEGPGICVSEGGQLQMVAGSVTDCARGGAVFRSASGSLEGVEICRHGENGLDLSSAGSGEVRVRNCALHHNVQSGCLLGDSAGARLVGCTVHDNRTGVTCRSCRGTLEDCTVRDNTEDGVLLSAGANLDVFRGKLATNGGHGLVVAGRSGGTFRECQIYGNALTNVSILSGSAPVLESCTMEGSRHNGVAVHNATGTLRNCTVVRNEWAGIEILQESGPHLEGLEVAENSKSGISVFGPGRPTVSNCTVTKNGACGLAVNDNGAPVVTGCRFTRNGLYGVWLSAAAAGKVTGCVIRENRAGPASRASSTRTELRYGSE